MYGFRALIAVACSGLCKLPTAYEYQRGTYLVCVIYQSARVERLMLRACRIPGVYIPRVREEHSSLHRRSGSKRSTCTIPCGAPRSTTCFMWPTLPLPDTPSAAPIPCEGAATVAECGVMPRAGRKSPCTDTTFSRQPEVLASPVCLPTYLRDLHSCSAIIAIFPLNKSTELPTPSLTRLGLQSRLGDKPVKFQVVCPRNGTAVLKWLKRGFSVSINRMLARTSTNMFIPDVVRLDLLTRHAVLLLNHPTNPTMRRPFNIQQLAPI